ncbi:MAG: methylated-DNA--[protein]-cysteine S-methyltransferase [Candidatus Mariimomonas ferrooxydans]
MKHRRDIESKPRKPYLAIKIMANPSLFYDTFESPIGLLYLVFFRKSLTEISFKKPSQIAFKKGSASKNFIKELEDFFRGNDKGFNQRIDFLKGTDFEKKIWSCLKDIPFGETRTYKWVAEKTGHPSASRAVGRALSKNPVPIVLPCHRIIESDGSIGGYSSGINIKRRLLELEYYSEATKKQDNAT